MKKKKSISHTTYFFVMIIAGFIIYKIWQFAVQPNALEKTIEFISVAALCIGAFVIFMAVLLITPSISNKIKKKPSSKATDLQYEVNAVRTKPAVNTWEGYGLIGGGVFYILFSLGICYIYIFWFTHGSINGFWEICSTLFSLFLALAMGIGSIYMLAKGIDTFTQNQDWMKGATKAHVSIVDRREDQYEYDQYTNIMTYDLILQVDDKPEIPELNDRFIRAEVSKRIFNKYAPKSSAVIYYATDSPLTFILQGE